MKKILKFWPFILICIVVLIFFLPIFKGFIPFPGDLLVNTNPYKAQSFLGYKAGSYPNKAQGPDVIYEIYPWRSFSIGELKKGEIPFWNPYNFSGNPQMADYQTAVFYPLNVTYFLLPFNGAWTLIIMLQPFLAALFMYLFLKKSIKVSDFASVIGGISFAFCSYLTVWIEYGNIGNTLLWLPLALLFTKFYFNKPDSKNFAGISITLVFALLAGYIQGAFYIYTLCFFYYLHLVLYNKGEFKKHKKNFLFLISLLLPLSITAFQILPTLNLFSESTREGYSLLQTQKNLLPIKNLITLFFPDFFGNPATRNYWVDGTYIERVLYPGTVILFFAFYSLINKVKLSEKKFFALVSLVSLIIATNLPFVKFFYLIPIPVISTTVPTRELSLFIFAVTVLGAMGINQFFSQKDFSKKIPAFYTGFFVLVFVLTLLIKKEIPSLSANLTISLHNLAIPSLCLFVLLVAMFVKKFNHKIAMIIIVVIVVFDLLYFFNKITPFAPISSVYPQTQVVNYLKQNAGLYRFWGYGSAYIPANFQSVDKTFSPEGNDPLHLERYSQLLSSSANGKAPKVLPRPDANIAPGYGTEELKNNFYRKRVLDLDGVKYVLDLESNVDLWKDNGFSTYPKDQYTLVKRFFPWRVYENKSVVPRFFSTGDYVLAKNKNEALSFVYKPSINLSKTIILETPPDLVIDKTPKTQVKLINYSPNEVWFNVRSTGNNLLFLSDNFYSQWSAEIDGKPSRILIADYAFRAVAVPKGEHTVRFFYNASVFILGLEIAGLGLLILFLLILYVGKNNKKI